MKIAIKFYRVVAITGAIVACCNAIIAFRMKWR